MSLEAFRAEYEAFFKKSGSIPQIVDGDNPVEMHPVQAVGTIDDAKFMIESHGHLSPEDLRIDAQQFFEDSFIGRAFLMHALAAHKEGHSLESKLDEIAGKLFIAPTPYELHLLKNGKRDISQDYAVFLDWDGTMETGGGLKDEVIKFLDHFKAKEDGARYHFIVTSASFELGGKVSKYPDVLERLDAVYAVPAVATMPGARPAVMGKLYNDVAKRLGVSSNRAIILTDLMGDRSVENQYPVATIVTPPNVSAVNWIKVIETLTDGGNRDFYAGRDWLRAHPAGLHPTEIEGVSGKDLVRRYELGEVQNGTKHPVNLYRTKLVSNVFFLSTEKSGRFLPDNVYRDVCKTHELLNPRYERPNS